MKSSTAGVLPSESKSEAPKTLDSENDFSNKELDELEKPLEDDEDDLGKKTPLPSDDQIKSLPPDAATINAALAAKIPDIAVADPPDDRVVTSVLPIPRRPLTEEMLFTKDNGRLPNLELLKTHFLREGKITHGCAVRIIETASAIFRKEPNLLHLHDPITVCGDLHGQYYDMMRLLQVGGDPAEVQYLFLGDYVDRGCFSCEVLLYLFAVKISFPNTFFMLRGNHECRHLTSFFNFRDECVFKYTIDLYNEFMESFDSLPLAATINEKFLCMHGGLSPDVTVLSDINDIERFREVPREGPMCDLLWSDPFDENQEHETPSEDGARRPLSQANAAKQNGDAPDSWFMYNETRQCSFVFGVSAVETFLKKNHLTAVIRAHEAQLEGYRMQMQNKHGIPRVITIFSAPNYCDVYRNKGACLHFDDELLNIRQFMNCEHPYYLPNFMDVFSWSLPFVAEKVTDMLASVIGSNGDGSESESDSEAEPVAIKVNQKKSQLLAKRGGILKEKVLAVTKLVRVYKTLREHNELVIQLKQLTPNKMIPQGLLSQGKDAIAAAVQDFKSAHTADLINERRPSFDGLPAELFDPKPPSQAGSKKNSVVDVALKSQPF